jgi:hypothetical protein
MYTAPRAKRRADLRHSGSPVQATNGGADAYSRSNAIAASRRPRTQWLEIIDGGTFDATNPRARDYGPWFFGGSARGSAVLVSIGSGGGGVVIGAVEARRFKKLLLPKGRYGRAQWRGDKGARSVAWPFGNWTDRYFR